MSFVPGENRASVYLTFRGELMHKAMATTWAHCHCAFQHAVRPKQSPIGEAFVNFNSDGQHTSLRCGIKRS